MILLDPSPLQSEPVEDQLRILLNELERYLPELVERPRLVVVSKADLPEASEAVRKVPEAMLVSAATRAGLDRFLHATADLVEGGVAGAVDIITRRPLQFARPVTVEAFVGGVYADLPKKTDLHAITTAQLDALDHFAGTLIERDRLRELIRDLHLIVATRARLRTRPRQAPHESSRRRG